MTNNRNEIRNGPYVPNNRYSQLAGHLLSVGEALGKGHIDVQQSDVLKNSILAAHIIEQNQAPSPMHDALENLEVSRLYGDGRDQARAVFLSYSGRGLEDALEMLKPRRREAVVLGYGLGGNDPVRTQKELGEIMGVRGETAGQNLVRGGSRLKHLLPLIFNEKYR